MRSTSAWAVVACAAASTRSSTGAIGKSGLACGAALAPARGRTHAISAEIGTSHRQWRGIELSFQWQARTQRSADHRAWEQRFTVAAGKFSRREVLFVPAFLER